MIMIIRKTSEGSMGGELEYLGLILTFWLLGYEGHGSKLNLEEELYYIKSRSRAM